MHASHLCDVCFWLMVGHAIADYILQSPSLNYDKNPHKPPLNDGTPRPSTPYLWIYAMSAHRLANAGAVALATGSVPLGIAEFVIHFGIDVARCGGRTSRIVDQGLHIACKVLWAVLA